MKKRAPIQVLAIPYKLDKNNKTLFGLLKRNQSTGGYWQPVAGGVHVGEEILAAARRELYEETGINKIKSIIELDSRAMIPRDAIGDYDWDKDVTEIPEYCFGFEIDNIEFELSDEHSEYRWLEFDDAVKTVYWESNKIALAELNQKIKDGLSA